MYPYISLFGIHIPSYGLCMAVGIIISCYISFSEAKRKRLNTNSLIVIAACAIGAGLLGAKILYLIVSCNINEVFARILAGDISDLTGGGQVFYGGLIGGIGGALIGRVISGERGQFAEYCNVAVLSIPVGHAFGRLGCFLAGCCYGAPYSGALAVTFPQVGVLEPVFPVQLLEAVLNIGIFLSLVMINRKYPQAFLLYVYMIEYSVVRFVLEYFRGDRIRGIAQELSTSQWISIGLFLTCILLVSVRTVRERRRM